MDQLNSEMNRNLTIIAIYCISNTVCCLSGWKAYRNYIFLEMENKPSSASHVVDDSFSFKILFTQLNSISNVSEWLITLSDRWVWPSHWDDLFPLLLINRVMLFRPVDWQYESFSRNIRNGIQLSRNIFIGIKNLNLLLI